MNEPKKNPESENNDSPNKDGESIAERSARLEQEATGLYQTREDWGNEPDDQDSDSNAHTEESHDSIDSMEGDAPIEIGDNKEIPMDAYSDPNAQALEEELTKTKEQMMRVAAEAENTKRRALKERDDFKKFAISSFAKDLLSVSDNLRRALEAIPDDLKEDARVTNLVEGIEATEREMIRCFEKNGIETIAPLDQNFDPNFHEVMFEAPVPGKPDGTVIEVMETGYILNGRLLRPARVGVSKGGEAGENDGNARDPGANLDTEI